ncbi:MAG: hypothetical protein H6623_04880 [Bdellovibrionaceae bacterium]|nr:hypothetical protein [Pseudobdellovibrionaceae bacterium]
MQKKLLVLFPLVFVFFASCESKEDDKVFSAQQCLDQATPSTVDTCVAMVSGIASSKSYVIRCSADFIRQNITNSTIVQAVENLDSNSNTGTDPNVTLYDYFVFAASGSSTAFDLVNSAVSDCSDTGSENLKVLALSAKAATYIKSLTGGGSIESWLNTHPDLNTVASSSPEEIQAIGETILAMQPIACGTGGQFEGTEVCTNLNNSIGSGSTAEEIAKQFLSQLQQNN